MSVQGAFTVCCLRCRELVCVLQWSGLFPCRNLLRHHDVRTTKIVETLTRVLLKSAAWCISALRGKMGKETAGKKIENRQSLKSNKMVHFAFANQSV